MVTDHQLKKRIANKVPSPEIDIIIYEYLGYDKGGISNHWNKVNLLIKESHREKDKIRSKQHTTHKIKF